MNHQALFLQNSNIFQETEITFVVFVLENCILSLVFHAENTKSVRCMKMCFIKGSSKSNKNSTVLSFWLRKRILAQFSLSVNTTACDYITES